MGMYDTFYSRDKAVEVQLKTGPCLLYVYSEGDVVDEFEDAVYHSPDGVVVIDGGIVRSVTRECPKNTGKLPHFTKWGDVYNLTDDINDHNPVVQAMNIVEKKYK